jgi:uncharacterized delta-60 repeat protein
MTLHFIGSRLLAVLLVAAAAACGAAASATAAPSVATAPGRAVVDVGGGTVLTSATPFGGLQASVPEPDGSMLLLFGSGLSRSTVRVMRIGLDGAPDRSFGDAGVKIVDLELSAYDRREIVRQPDGKLVIVSSVAESFGESHAHVLRLNADLSIDTTYGMRGSVTIDAFAPHDAALQSDGSLLLTGTTDGVPLSTPQALNLNWSLARVTSRGAVDRGFGTSGIVTIPTSVPMSITAYGDAVAAGTGGTILAVAQSGPGARGALLTRLTATGAPDRSFAGGVPVQVPLAYGQLMIARGNGSVLLEGPALGRKGSDGHVPQALARYTTAGALDRSYGEAGVANVGDDVSPAGLLPVAGGGAILSGLLYTPAADGTFPQPGHLEIRRLSARGRVTLRRSFTLGFGGGSAGKRDSRGNLLQNSFRGGQLVRRPDGTFLVPGGVRLSRPSGDGEEVSISRFAAAVLTSSLRLDGSFGGPARRLRVSVGLPRQDGAAVVREAAISIKLRLSSVGLARVRIAHRGRAVARGLVAVLGTSSQVSPIRLTPYGRQYLRGHPRAKLSIAVTARDLLTNVRSAHAAGRLG